MADTRPPGRGAGKALVAAILLGVALAGCRSAPGSGAAAAVHPVLLPVGSYNGGRLANGAFQIFVAPVAVAIHEADIFVADAGLNGLFHLDTTTLALRRLGSFPARTGMRLKALGDGTLYVLDPFARDLLRLSRDGRVLERLHDELLLAGAADLALEEPPGRLLVVDRAQHRILLLSRTLGGAVQLIVQRGEHLALDTPWSIAAAPDEAYVVDRARSQVARIDARGAVRQNFGALELKLPDAIAVDRYRRVFVRDAFDDALHVFVGGVELAKLAAGELGVGRIGDFAILDSSMVVAGSGGGTVRVFRLRAPEARP
jgi:hypothetical protein